MCDVSEWIDKSPIVRAESKEAFNFRDCSGLWPRFYCCHFAGVWSDTLFTDYKTQVIYFPLERTHFFGDNFSLAFLNRSNTWPRLASSWENVHPGTRMSSKYTRATDTGKPTSTYSIKSSNVAGALQRPNGLTLNCHPIGPANSHFEDPVQRSISHHIGLQVCHQYEAMGMNPCVTSLSLR